MPVTSRAIMATNGVIYAINKVLIPETERSIVGVLAGDSRFSTLVTAAKVAGLVSTLDTGNKRNSIARKTERLTHMQF